MTLSVESLRVILGIGEKLIGMVWLLLFQFSVFKLMSVWLEQAMHSSFYQSNGVQCFKIISLKHRDKTKSSMMLEIKDLSQQSHHNEKSLFEHGV